MEMTEVRTYIPTTCKPPEGKDRCDPGDCERGKFSVCIYGQQKLVEVRNPRNGVSSGGNSYFDCLNHRFFNG